MDTITEKGSNFSIVASKEYFLMAKIGKVVKNEFPNWFGLSLAIEIN